MKSLILVVCVLVLSACQDGAMGSGPLTLSPEFQPYFDEYMERDSPTVFVVSTDGNVASYLYCPSAADACIPGRNIFHVLESCQKRSGGVPCKIYAKGRNIVWERAIHGTASEPEKNVSEQSLQQARNFNGRKDEEICTNALSANREAPSWDNRTRWREYVNEAERRDFTPQSCAKLLRWNAVSSEKKPSLAGLPPASLVPEAEHQKIEQYFKQNEHALKGQLGKYNERNGIAESSLGYEWYSINQIISLEVLSVDDKKAFVKLGFSVGRWRDVFEYVYEVQWVASKLRFVGHRKI